MYEMCTVDREIFLVNIKLICILNFHFTNISSLNSSSVVRPVSVSTQRNGKIRSIAALYISSHGTCVLNISISVHCQVSLSYTRQLFAMRLLPWKLTNDNVAMEAVASGSVAMESVAMESVASDNVMQYTKQQHCCS